MSVASPRLVKILAVIVIALIILQYSYTTFFESHWIEPLFIFNSSFLAKHHNYLLGNRLVNNSEKTLLNSSEQVSLPSAILGFVKCTKVAYQYTYYITNIKTLGLKQQISSIYYLWVLLANKMLYYSIYINTVVSLIRTKFLCQDWGKSIKIAYLDSQRTLIYNLKNLLY